MLPVRLRDAVAMVTGKCRCPAGKSVHFFSPVVRHRKNLELPVFLVRTFPRFLITLSLIVRKSLAAFFLDKEAKDRSVGSRYR